MARWEPPGWKRTRLAVIVRDGGICWLCGEAGADTADHVIPRKLGGSHHPSNLRAAHLSCNSRRRATPVTPAARIRDRWG